MDNINIHNINIEDYNYELPEDRIAQYPVPGRDRSKLLVYRKGEVTGDLFRNIAGYIPEGSLLVFNNSKVIKARLLFGKDTGAVIEILCLEPHSSPDYELSFASTGTTEWKCIVGNLKKWKKGSVSLTFNFKGKEGKLFAEKTGETGEAWIIKFTWEPEGLRFGEVLEAAGHMPLPPYIEREDRQTDTTDYQTVYSSVRGSVAAPTAGFHFTDRVFESFEQKRIATTEITLHVGAGTFKPVKVNNAARHEMHHEHFIVSRESIEKLINFRGKIIPVGTTSLRTIESLYWIGIKILQNPGNLSNFELGQWEPYNMISDIAENEAFKAILDYMHANNLVYLYASTGIMIVPGYKFRMTEGIITNFHQPRSTLLLLISAWTGEKWKEIYNYALENKFRFLSYGDSSLLLRSGKNL